MDRFTTFAAAAASLFAFSATAADAGVYLGFEQDGGGIITVDSDSANVTYGGAFGNFEVNVFSGAGGVYPQLLGTSGKAHNLGGGNAGTLDVYVTVTDLATVPTGFFSSFASSVLPAGWSLQLRTYADAGNGLYGGTLLSNHTFTVTGTFEEDLEFNVGAAPYSLTA